MKDDENHWITLLICAVIVVVFFGVQGILGIDLAWNVGSFEPNFFFSMIAHGSVGHLLGNLFALGLFGLLLEGTIGTRRYLWILLAAGVVANLSGVFAGYNRVLGISGVVYGIFGALAVLRPKMMVWAGGVPVPMIVAALGWTFIDLVGVFAGPTGTAHLAHIAGAVAGVVAGFLLKKKIPEPPEGSRKKLRRSREETRRIDKALDTWEDRYMVA